MPLIALSYGAMSITQKIVVDAEGKPLEVIIPYKEFVELFEDYGLDLSEEEKAAIVQAQRDRQEGRTEAFISLEQAVKAL